MDCSIAPNNMIGFPRTPSIFDSPVNPGTYIYEATVGSEVAGAPVTIHPPNEATTTIGPNELFVFPSLGNNTRHQQTMKTVLKYNGNPLGKCASVCCSEKVKITVEAVHEKNLGKIAFNISAWYPSPCFSDEHFGDSKNPNDWTMKWDSPNFFDKNWKIWTLDGFNYIQTLTTGTVIANRTHEYRFKGKRCNGTDWGPLDVKVELELIIRPARNSSGTEIQPTRMIPEWRVK